MCFIRNHHWQLRCVICLDVIFCSTFIDISHDNVIFFINVIFYHQSYILKSKGKFLYSALSSPQDCSKRFISNVLNIFMFGCFIKNIIFLLNYN